ncbi:hypothetical protein H7Y63_03745 [Polaromonas sp.]|nr:hypothetical protein [Candidatus Saccharibacteria bacterium]
MDAYEHLTQAAVDARFMELADQFPVMDIDQTAKDVKALQELLADVEEEIVDDHKARNRKRAWGWLVGATAALGVVYLAANPMPEEDPQVYKEAQAYTTATSDGFEPYLEKAQKQTHELQFLQELGKCTLLVSTEAITSIQPVGASRYSQQYRVAVADQGSTSITVYSFAEVERQPILSHCVDDNQD